MRPAPIWEEEALRAFCRDVLAAFPRHEDHCAQGTLAGQQPAGGCAQ